MSDSDSPIPGASSLPAGFDDWKARYPDVPNAQTCPKGRRPFGSGRPLVHLTRVRYGIERSICGHFGVTLRTDDEAEVTCTDCLRRLARGRR